MDFKSIQNAITGGDGQNIVEITQEAIESNIDPEKILNQGLIAAMDIVGEKFSAGELYVPEMLQAAIAMKKGLKLLKPLLLDSGTKRKGTVVIGTVKGDLHDIGKNLVVMMLEGAGFKVIDLGVDISPETFLDSIRENKAQVCAMSALLTTTMPGMEETVKLVKSEFGDQQIKTIIGGAPVSPRYAGDIGADGFAHDAGAAVERVKRLIDALAS